MSSEPAFSKVVAEQNTWWVPARVEQPELLDLGVGSPADVQANLKEMWRANRYFGGLPALTRHLYPCLAALKGISTTLIDLGSGSAEIPIRIAHWAHLNGLQLHILCVDYSSRNLAVAADNTANIPAISLLQANAICLPFPPESVDFVISSLVLHHLTPQEVVTLLQSALSCARRGIILTDLTRSRLALMAFRLAQPMIARNFLTRHDGVLSFRRAYTPAELYALAQAAGLPQARIYMHWGWRMTLVVDK